MLCGPSLTTLLSFHLLLQSFSPPTLGSVCSVSTARSKSCYVEISYLSQDDHTLQHIGQAEVLLVFQLRPLAVRQ